MSQESCLAPVIHAVDSVTQAGRPGEKRVIVNADTRTAIGDSQFYEAKGELEARLAARALAETGLDVTAELSRCDEETVARHARLGLDRHGGIPAAPYETREEVEHHVAGHAAPFIVSSAMQLSVTDHATYIASGTPPLGS
jgi:hypothetical protein